MASAAVVRTPKALYRFLLREISVLPSDARSHYKHRIRQVGRHCMYLPSYITENELESS